ncbi:MAG TPA: lysozyme inhibitor LprI family protein [Candidatus Acidoferrales bacterium]
MRYGAILFFVIFGAGTTMGQTTSQTSKEYSACNEKAKTQIEMNGCASAEATRADKELNRVYAQVLVKAASVPDAEEKAKASERAWVAYRDAYIDAAYPAKDKQTEYGSMYPLEVELLRAKLTERQTLALEELLKQYSGGNNPN